MNNIIPQSVFRTLSYFDIFNLPLTRQALHKYKLKINLATLGFEPSGAGSETLGRGLGYFWLSGQRKIVAQHLYKLNQQSDKWIIALRAAKFVSYVPFVRMVAVGNTLADSSAGLNSDIDFFIVVKAGRIWLARFLITGLLDLFRLRRHRHNVTNRICLSFYITDKALNLKPLSLRAKQGKARQLQKSNGIALPSDPDKFFALTGLSDIYLLYWIAQLKVLYSSHKMANKFFKANSWIKKYLPNWCPSLGVPEFRRVKLSWLVSFSKNLSEKILSYSWGDVLNALTKKWQLKRIYANQYSRLQEPTTDVVVNDNVLKFHERDQRAFIQKEFIKRVYSVLSRAKKLKD